MRKTVSFGVKAVQTASKQSGLVSGFYRVVEFYQLTSVCKLVGYSHVIAALVRHLSAPISGVFISVSELFVHLIHKTYNNKLQFKLINS